MFNEIHEQAAKDNTKKALMTAAYASTICLHSISYVNTQIYATIQRCSDYVEKITGSAPDFRMYVYGEDFGNLGKHPYFKIMLEYNHLDKTYSTIVYNDTTDKKGTLTLKNTLNVIELLAFRIVGVFKGGI